MMFATASAQVCVPLGHSSLYFSVLINSIWTQAQSRYSTLLPNYRTRPDLTLKDSRRLTAFNLEFRFSFQLVRYNIRPQKN